MKDKLNLIYKKLLEEYGFQGWWPLLSLHKNGINPTKTGSMNGYHPKDYSFPRNKNEQFEIIIGTVLTQNTSWTSVEKSLFNLKKLNSISPEKILKISLDEFKNAIKPSGYYNQKAERLKLLAKWFIDREEIPTRDELLKLKGVGPETADSILLYAYKIPSFVIDTYTKRTLIKLKLIDETFSYNEIKKFFEDNLELDFKIFQEFHALLVEHAKRLKSGEKDFLLIFK